MRYVAASAINLATLVIGFSIGVFASRFMEQTVAAQPSAQSTSSAVTVEQVSPSFTVGSSLTNLSMSHEIYADTVVVNGIDVLKLEQGIINYLSRHGGEPPELLALINEARAKKMYKVALPAEPPSSTLPPANPPAGAKK